MKAEREQDLETDVRLSIEHAVTRVLAESSGIAEAAPKIIRVICEALGWACGARWEHDERNQVVRCAETWGVASAGIEAFLEATRRRPLLTQPGGLSRRTWAERKPIWIRDVTQEATFLRAPDALKAGLRSAFAFPIKVGAQVNGVMEFFSRQIHQPDTGLLDCMTYVGSQIGQFMERKRAEQEQRRFRAAVDVSADLVLLADPASMLHVDANETACRALGYSREELLAMGPHDISSVSREHLSQIYDRLIAGGVSETSAEGRFRRKDGSRFAVELFRRVVPSENGHVIVVVARDVGERKRADQLLKLEHTVTRSLAEADSALAALKAAMQAVCETEGWECGRYFGVDEKAGVMRFAEAWSVPGETMDNFIARSREVTYAAGAGLLGSVWQSGQPLWIADIAKDARVHKGIARDIGMHGAFFFPVTSQGKTIGVFSFHSREVREPEERLLQAISVIGSQIGQFLQRKQAEDVVRESEGRFRSLTELSSDFYWQTDAEHRLVQTQYDRKDQPLNSRRVRSGKTRWELPSTHPDAAGWAAHRATLEAHLPFRDFELARIDKDGVERHLSISGEPVFDAAGVFQGYRGVGKEITARKREEQVLNLEHAVTRCLSEADSVSDALKSVIRTMCESQAWECGRYFHADEKARLLRFGEAWGIADPAIERYMDASRDATYSRDAGSNSTKIRVWQTGEPLWTSEMSKGRGLAKSVLGSARDSFAFAVMAEGKALGVLAFTSRKVREPDARLLQAVRVIGSQIGQFLQRKQAEEVRRESEERFRSLTGLSSDWYWEQDENFRFTQMTNAIKDTAERGPQSNIGKTRWDLPALNMTEADWAAHRALLETHQPFYDLELYRRTANGMPKYTSISGEPIFDRSGLFKGYRGVGKDITERKRAEQLRALEHAVNRSLADADGASAGLKAAIRAVCETEEWDCGRYFRVDEKAGVLRFAEAWSLSDPAVERFIARSRDLVYRPGEGLSGRAWQSGRPLWSADVTKDPRSSSGSSKAGPSRDMEVHGTFVFPVVSDGKTIGVLSFASRKAREPEERLLQAINVVGSQIGQFVERKQAAQVLRESEERFRSLTGLSSDMYWEQDDQFRFTSMTGIGSERVNVRSFPALGKKRWEQSYVNMTAEAWAEHIALLEAHKPFRDMELCRLDETGKKIWISISGEPVFDSPGAFKGYRGVGKDITGRKLDEERIQYLANHDALTSLPNRSMFSEVLNLAIHNARRYNRNFAVLFVDLDRFKIINDTLGHEAGDKLLKEMGERLTRTVRSSDVVARLGGDEFVVLVQEVAEAKQAEAVARKILSALIKPTFIQGQEYRVTASIGICMYPADAQDEQALMKNADIAMYRAKEDGKNTYKFYSADTNVHSLERLALETSLRRALERNEFFLQYQAKLDLHTRQITGVEALVRWQHPDLGMVPPAQFIPLAEETGLIVPLGKWVLNTACAQNVAWQREGLPPLRMAVNLSARQFADEELLKDISAALDNSGMKPELLELELTESMVMQNAERAGKVLAEIKLLGVRLAIDDFGVGYSSLTHLKRFPIDTLKVDRSFIRDIPQDHEDKAITEAIIAMGKSLNLTVVAEGVETLEQQTFLQDHDCDEMQGFYFSKPILSSQFADLLRKHMQLPKATAA